MSILELANAEATVIGYLNSLPALVPEAAGAVPNPRPASFIRVSRVGGSERNMIQEQPLLLIECWGADQTEAWLTARQCWEALQGRDELVFNGIELQERRLSSPVNYPDPSTASPRYQFTLQTTINLKGPSS